MGEIPNGKSQTPNRLQIAQEKFSNRAQLIRCSELCGFLD